MPTSYCDSACVTSADSRIPSGSPSAAPISAVITLSWRIIRRACRRVMPIVRSMPSSRVRSNTDSTSVLTMPNSDTITENASITYSRFRKSANPDVYSRGNSAPVYSTASLNGSAAAVTAFAAPGSASTNVNRFLACGNVSS